ncbi:hypothetical protein Glove_144g101 [Diversispora epigaea]|uniref:Amino acid permease/ SLC12A domain-containing protein n=1 Tax=Diversispora epigaea TaxID=1348612 RepID=A0A397J305_9GLOM|nr:hypothetical protein Glove_144g101 [Diversispora epigaea]
MSEDRGTKGTGEMQIVEHNAIYIDSQNSSSSESSSFNDDKNDDKKKKVLGIFSGMYLCNPRPNSGIDEEWRNDFGHLGSSISESGGEQIYFEKAFPNPKKIVAYIFSFSSVVLVKPISIISISTAGSQYIYYAIHNGYNLTELEDKHAFGIISIITIYHLFSNKVAVWMNQLLAIIKVSTLLTVVIIGLIRIKEHPERLSFTNLFSKAHGIKYYNNYTNSMLKVLFAYSGWNTLNYSLDEMRNSRKRLRISNPASVLIVGILYCLAILAFLTVSDPEKVQNFMEDPVTMSANLGDEIGSGIEIAIAILIAISCFGAVGSGIWGSSRLIASVAKAGFIPVFSPVLRKFDEKWNTPFNALIFQWCYLTMILCIPINNVYDVLVLRKTEPKRPRPFRIDTSWVYFFILFSLAIFIGTFSPNIESDYFIGKYYYIITYTVIIFGLICWYLIYYRPRINSNSTPPEMANVVMN